MPKPTAREVIPFTVAAVCAGLIANDLADHNVGVGVIVSVVLSLLSMGVTLATRFQQATHTVLFTCPESGCPVEIRATNQPDQSIPRLRELATDHSQHIPARS